METASVAQLYRIWAYRTAAGQSLWAWSSVIAALVLWFQWYRIITPQEKLARWTTLVSIVLCTAIFFSVWYWRLHAA